MSALVALLVGVAVGLVIRHVIGRRLQRAAWGSGYLRGSADVLEHFQRSGGRVAEQRRVAPWQ